MVISFTQHGAERIYERFGINVPVNKEYDAKKAFILARRYQSRQTGNEAAALVSTNPKIRMILIVDVVTRRVITVYSDKEDNAFTRSIFAKVRYQ